MKKKFMFLFLITSLLSLAKAYSAGSTNVDMPKQFELIEPPQCKDFRGQKVVFKSMPHEQFLQRKLLLAVAGIEDGSGTPVVYYDQDDFLRIPEIYQKLVLQHECEHHMAGDMVNPPRDAAERGQRELLTDCKAIQNLKKTSGFSYEDLLTVASYSAKLFTRNGLPQQMFSIRMSNFERCLMQN